MTRSTTRLSAGLLTLLLSMIVFIGSACLAGTDPQGSFLFLLSVPLTVLLLLATFFLCYQKTGAWATSVRSFSWLGLLFVFLFVAGAFFHPLNFVPRLTLQFSSDLFKIFTGQTPYEYAKSRRDVLTMIRNELQRTHGQEIDFSRFHTGLAWDKVCLFGPHTTNDQAVHVLGVSGWDLSMYSRVGRSTDIDTFVFVDSRRQLIRYLAELPRKEADFASDSGRCFHKEIVKVPVQSQPCYLIRSFIPRSLRPLRFRSAFPDQ